MRIRDLSRASHPSEIVGVARALPLYGRICMRRILCFSLLLGACGHAQAPGTHVEVMDKDGGKLYVSGAAGPGMNKALACETAANRAVAALAQRFADDNGDIAD